MSANIGETVGSFNISVYPRELPKTSPKNITFSAMSVKVCKRGSRFADMSAKEASFTPSLDLPYNRGTNLLLLLRFSDLIFVMDLAEIQNYIGNLLAALRHIHKLGIIHRLVILPRSGWQKPRNADNIILIRFHVFISF